jgi:hypothetical protein
VRSGLPDVSSRSRRALLLCGGERWGGQMPFSPKFKVGTAPYSNLRQALQWIKDEIRPVDPAYERALGIDTWSRGDDSCAAPNRDYKQHKSELYVTICAGVVPLFGRPGIGALKAEDFRDISFRFDRYGERELVPISRLHEAGFEKLDFRRSRICKVTEWDDHGWPEKGWGYSDLVIPTADLRKH